MRYARVFLTLGLFVVSMTFLYSRYQTSNKGFRRIHDALNFGYQTSNKELRRIHDTLNFGYLDAYCKTFLTSAEQHFMLGLPVTYYVFTDLPEMVPNIELGPHRSLKVIKVAKHSRWQDISMMRMKTISEAIAAEICHNFTYVFCFDVDQEFKGRFGSEALGDSVALLHAHYYKRPQNMFTYDRNSKSKAYMETGDFYYHAAIFGGAWENVKNLTDSCYLSIMEDKLNNVEALWHDESHLNKYFWLNKPSKLLSPEYCWDQSIGDWRDINITRLVWAPKNYDALRDSLKSH
ncbi:N-acetyllactosaminide alpha-1,3-galactosyltransferase-like isoform X3 [Scophthalmus maximus]|uniref:N-acetyllactosaminide alpha-1,3-galactosyltransferase-like isoform X3 n=1 Tax=Scophthalmus maximus TaxID=52904 RepID=UPI0015E0D5A6|nr:N-acetyllactosaminide alpha-1,3-galactosyltransferase-like isoform X3 [Scophthalmus maximus]